MASANEDTGISRPLGRRLKLVDLNCVLSYWHRADTLTTYFSKQIDKIVLALKKNSHLKLFVLKEKQQHRNGRL